MANMNGFSVWLLIGASMTIVFFFLLVSVSVCQAQQFCATTIFSFILIGSFVMIMSLFLIDHPSAKAISQLNSEFFFMRGLTLRKLVWIPIGLGAVILGAYGGVAIGQPFLALAIAGIILLFTLFKTKNALVPIIIHGAYNSFVVWSQGAPTGSFLNLLFSSSPIVGHTLGLSLGVYSDLASQILFQVFLVAVAEEIFKIFLIEFVIVATRGKFDLKNSIRTYGAGIASVAIWVSYHSIDNNYH